MGTILHEFANENELTSYPFASGCRTVDTDGRPIGIGVLVDAALYPVNPNGNLYLSGISATGVVSVSDDSGVVMSATIRRGSSVLEFTDMSPMKRHVGTIVASSAEAMSVLADTDGDRKFKKGATTFASSCVFPVMNGGVLSLDIGGAGAVDGEAAISNGPEDEVRASTSIDGSTLRFDVIPAPRKLVPRSIQHVYCVVDGRTPFRIFKAPFGQDGNPSNTVEVYLDNIDKDAICGNAHRENALEMVDTCGCESGSSSDSPEKREIPMTFQCECVDIPNGAHNAFYLAVPNMSGYTNPLSITLTDGAVVPSTTLDAGVDVDALDTEVPVENLVDHVTSKGAVLQVPGLSPIQ